MPERPPSFEPARLKRNIEWALRHAFEERDVLPMVEALARSAERGSRDWVFAHRQLAELVVEKQPWRAAIAARLVARFAPDDDGARALQGLALTLLGHYQCAVRAYRSALAIAPDNPWYAHNLGHLLDVALNRPHESLGLLRRAFLAEPHPEIASSLAHALARTGRVDEAKKVLSQALEGSRPTPDQAALLEWLDQGAPLVRPGASKGRARKQQHKR
jgi:Flp pilus assembly protein TadD